ncbi:MAG: hypothetical protein ACRD2R_06940 [Terriglobales bacterium]
MPRTITATAPCRVDLAGGTLDIWPLYLFHPGAVTVNFAVNIQTRCTVRSLRGRQVLLRSVDTGREEGFRDLDALRRARRYRHPLAARLLHVFTPRGGLLVETCSESPAGAGISGSSALMIAAAAALARFCRLRLSKEQLRVLSQNVEAQVIGVPTGCQDYYPALFGGISAIHLGVDGVHHEALAVPAQELDARFLLAYTGVPRRSGINNWEVFKAHLNGDQRVASNFEEIARLARVLRAALVARDWDAAARALRGEWKLRRSNAPGIATPLIDRLVAAAIKSGARAAKVCGAGGGGCVVFLVAPGLRQRVSRVLAASGAQILSTSVARRGLRVTEH